MNHKMW